MLKEGDIAPSFCLPNELDERICLKDFTGKWVVVYFYPKDMTPGCTTEACDFSDNFLEFKDMKTEIIGISPDAPKSHTKFIEKYSLQHILLSDPEHDVLEKFGVWQMKKLYGKEYMGVVRSTFLINPEGKIAKVWEKVKVKDHVEDVKGSLNDLIS
ncbi:MAG: thioredoxin-dependent thiol peroxidase [Candidatus Heimdallarchaeota archaeon]|jgi:peroxiredoxin Q/BCP|nr:thioredoxin-dependent thiol peroxidase [Candidatus Heimdallarchaeota archaeon]MCK4771096.1 thioredoxin-dependent thiol peroxidase [Candidatus Heimdallarchaeota archaeon]